MPYVIIREVATDRLAISELPEGFGRTLPADPSVRWAGFFASLRSARVALKAKGRVEFWYDDTRPTIESLLYGPAIPMNGTPGPESVKELFRIGGK